MGAKVLILRGDTAAIPASLASGASLVSFDLEDTVPEAAKPAARAAVPGFIRAGRTAGVKVGVRISPLSTPESLEDILMLRGCPEQPDMIVLTKVEHAEEIRLLDQLLSGPCQHVPFSPIIETPRGLVHAEEILGCHPRIASASFGGKDYSIAAGIARQWEPMLHARARLSNAAAMAGIPFYDEPFPNRDDLEGLRQNCEQIRAMGFAGKSAVDLRHVAVINGVFG